MYTGICVTKLGGKISKYVIVWITVAFGTNCASNAGWEVVNLGSCNSARLHAAEHYYCFLPVSTITVSCLHYESN